MADVQLLAKLSESFGVPGHEKEIAQIMAEEFRKSGYKVDIDRFGNVIARSPACRKKPLMIGAHMDEIGMLVKFINEKGFIRFAKIGGIDNRVLVNQRVVIQTENGRIYGVIGSKPPHMQKPEEAKNAIDNKQLFIDIGARSKKEAEKMGVKIGDPISFDMQLKVLNGKLVTGKALDDRVGCYVLLEVARRVKNKNVVLVGTAQEEVSTFGKGAMIAAYNLEPSQFIAIDTSIAGDHPEMSEDEAVVHLGKGPVLSLVEAGGRGNVADAKLKASCIAVAKKHKIPYQLEVIEGGATDAASVYGEKGGIPSIAICVPTRYIHSNVAVCSIEDIEKSINYIAKLADELA
ncbi:MAG: M42 family metallopeptidase [Candidatus Micrarchaeota archaeon]|nr:M42 family metallopeptidase [Candidatus Micrarchaeota archaeon]